MPLSFLLSLLRSSLLPPPPPLQGLLRACEQGDLEEVQRLRASTAAQVFTDWLKGHDASGATPLHLACRGGHVALVWWLLRQPGVEVSRGDHERRSAFFSACQEGHVEVVRVLAGDGRVDPNQPMKTGITPFLAACQRGHVGVVRLLSHDPRVDLNQREQGGRTPLLSACKKGKAETVRVLVGEERVEVNLEDYEGATPLWVAAERNDLRIIRVLLASGREVETRGIPNFEHLTAAEVAREKGHLLAADLIEEYERDPQLVAALLRRNMLDELASEVFSLIIFHCDGLLELVQP